jgi:hypothetical protein
MSRPTLTFYHTVSSIEAVVRAWFENRSLPRHLEGGRSIHIAHPDLPGYELKIKGAGLFGGPIDFSNYLKSRLRMPVFDFDGRMMDNVACSPDNAHPGGMSFQQASTEYKMSIFLKTINIPHIPCIGYGKFACQEGTSWFSLHEWNRKFFRVREPAVSDSEYAESGTFLGHLHIRLALDYNLIGHTEVAGDGERYYLLDLHSFRQMDALNMSQISWVMQVSFFLHLMALERALYMTDAISYRFPRDSQAFPFRCVLPDVTREDHEHFRSTVVVPYMLRPPAEFSMKKLEVAINANRITCALRAVCPGEFARP